MRQVCLLTIILPAEKAFTRMSGSKSQVTVIVCESDTDQAITLFVIFDAKMLSHN